MVARVPAPRLDRIPDPHLRKRVMTTISSTDVDDIPKVEGAGEVFEVDGVSVQRMHNGVLVEEGGYGGDWMTEIIRSLHGHHEPQEERVFHAIIERLKIDAGEKHMIEFGSFWSYYSLWFASQLDNASVIGLEPDPNNLELGRRNAALNDPAGKRITFLHGAVGPQPGELLTFTNESDGATTEVPQYSLGQLIEEAGWSSVDLILVDIQGAETALLELARDDLVAGRVRFAVISTHHNSISGDPLTHQRAVQYFVELGVHIIAEHSVPESFSGDGLIAVAFEERDSDLVVPVGFARARDSIFDELEWELRRSMDREADTARDRDAQRLRADQLTRIEASLPWRATRPLRRVYSWARRGRNG